mmetsp:Transcript_40621/g.48755  ORF Transcript_40621/g.48755 Transcript_40621/m.48755 type:complete len:269 (-) Transcript_40621:457-1263(-)
MVLGEGVIDRNALLAVPDTPGFKGGCGRESERLYKCFLRFQKRVGFLLGGIDWLASPDGHGGDIAVLQGLFAIYREFGYGTGGVFVDDVGRDIDGDFVDDVVRCVIDAFVAGSGCGWLVGWIIEIGLEGIHPFHEPVQGPLILSIHNILLQTHILKFSHRQYQMMIVLCPQFHHLFGERVGKQAIHLPQDCITNARHKIRQRQSFDRYLDIPENPHGIPRSQIGGHKRGRSSSVIYNIETISIHVLGRDRDFRGIVEHHGIAKGVGVL